MIDDILRKIKEEASKIRLEKEEKSLIRHNLMSMMKSYPVRNENMARQSLHRSKFNFNFLSLKLLRNPMPLILIVALLVGGGASYAAEGALPGDLLYPIKVGVNEEVRALVAFSGEAKANWEAERAGRRLEEAEKLAAQGNLDNDTSVKIEEKFENHADKVRQKIEEFNRKQDFKTATEVSSNFAISLKAHEKIISNLASASEGSELDALSQKVRTESENMDDTRLDVQAKIKIKAETQSTSENNSSVDRNNGENKVDADNSPRKTPKPGQLNEKNSNNGEIKENTELNTEGESSRGSVRIRGNSRTNIGL